MKKEHKVQRNLNPTFQAELKICSLCGLTTWWQRMVCVGSGDGPWRWLSGAHLPGRCTCGGQRRGGRQRLWAQWAVLCCSWDSALIGGMRVGSLGPLALGQSIPPPVCWGLHRRAAKSPGLRRFSQNPAFTLPASELLLVLFLYLRLLCPRLRIRETIEKPTAMQTHEGLFTSLSLFPSIPDRAEQGLGPGGGF